MAVHGGRPKPRLAVVGKPKPEVVERLRGTFPTLHTAPNATTLVGKIAPEELDLVVFAAEKVLEGIAAKPVSAVQVVENVSCIAFGESVDKLPGPTPQSEIWVGSASQPHGVASGEEFEAPEGVPPILAERRGDLVRALSEREQGVRGLGLIGRTSGVPAHRGPLDEGCLVVAVTPRRALAVAYVRTEPRVGVAWLPCVPTSAEWVTSLAFHWAQEGVDGLSALASWDLDAWLTRDELEAKRALEQAKRTRDDTLAELETDVARRADAFQEAQARAAIGLRRVLTEKGQALTDAVSEVLRDLGFEVEDVDQTREEGEAKLEDLRLRVPDDEAWIALAEVKGTTRGAKANGLLRLTNHGVGFREREGRPSSQLLYIVNPECDHPPSARNPEVLQGAEDQVAAFQGLVVPTKELFRLHRAREKIGYAKARQLLMTGRGVFAYGEGSRPAQ